MRHPDEGRILAFLDGVLEPEEGAELGAHVSGCPNCQARLAGLEEAVDRARRALALVDVEPRTARVREAIRARVTGERSQPAGRRRRPTFAFPARRLPLSLPRAAGIVLLLAGTAAAAVPGSPLREWIVSAWESARAPDEAAVGEEGTEVSGGGEEESTVEPEPLETSVTLPPEEGAVELTVHEAVPGIEVTVAWVDGQQAGIIAGEGTGFRTEVGRLDAFAPPGPVRVQLPRALSRAVVVVNGVLLYRQEGEAREILGEVVRQGENEIVFRAPVGSEGNPNASRF